jgi:hypothetical protein
MSVPVVFQREPTSSRRSVARLGWRQSVRRQRWFKAEDGQLAPAIQQARRQIDARPR